MKPLFEGHTLLFWRHIKGTIFSVLLVIDQDGLIAGSTCATNCVIINWRYVWCRLVYMCVSIVCWPECQLMLVAPGKSITLIAVWQSVFMTGDRGALPSMEEKHIDLSPGDLRRLSNLALRTDGHVECFSTESGIDCVELNGRVIFFSVHLTQPSCHPFFPAICSYDSLALPQNLLFCLFYLFWMSCRL